MLSADAAKAFLSKWRVGEEPENPFAQKKTITRFQPAIARLPKTIRTSAYELWGLNAQGELPAAEANPRRFSVAEPTWDAFFALSPGQQLKILSIPFPRMADEVLRALAWLTRAPYQIDFARKAYRVPGDEGLARPGQVAFLKPLLELAEQFDGQVISVPWLVVWSPFITLGWTQADRLITPLLAAALDGRDRAGDEIFELLLTCGRGEHEHGGMGRQVIGGLLAADRPEGWEFVEKLLLAAQRQEGLRQSILEEVDLAHPEAFLRMLKLIREENLARFSAVARALNVWLGYAWDSAAAGVINKTIDRLTELLEVPQRRAQAAAGQDAERLYLALWSWGVTDVKDSLPFAARALKSKDPAIRFAAVTHLANVRHVSAARQLLLPVLDDPDLRIAATAMQAVTPTHGFDASTLGNADRAALFDRLRRLVDRLPAKREPQAPLVWPWSIVQLDQENAAQKVVECGAGQPLEVLLPYVRLMSSYRRASFLEKLAERPAPDAEAIEEFVRALGDASQVVRSAAARALGKVTLTGPQRQSLEGYLTRKSADLRTACQTLLASGKPADAFGSIDRLLAASQAAQRLAGLEILRELATKQDDPQECIARAKAYRASARKPGRDELVQLEAIEKAAVRSPQASAGYGLFDPLKRSVPVPPKARRTKIWTSAAAGILKSLDDLVHEHREAEITTYGGTTQPLGTVRYGFPTPGLRGRPGQTPRELPLREVWETWLRMRPARLRDRDGYELLRATMYFELYEDYSSERRLEWLKASPDRTAIAEVLPAEKLNLRYPRIIQCLLNWLLEMEPPASPKLYYVNGFETLCSLLSPTDIASLDPRQGKPYQERGYSYRRSLEPWDASALIEDWRHHSPLRIWRQKLGVSLHAPPSDRDFVRRLWGLECWWDRPHPAAYREPIPVELCCLAIKLGIANSHDIYDQLLLRLGPYSGSGAPLLETFTTRRPNRAIQKVLRRPEVREAVDRTTRLIVETELERGEQPTPLTTAAHHLGILCGVDWLIRLLTALGKDGFKLVPVYVQDIGRRTTLTKLVTRTVPTASETPEACAAALRQAVSKGQVSEERLIQLAFLAPQWVHGLEVYFGWPGLSEAIYWFLAHMGFLWGSDVMERAADSGSAESEGEDPPGAEDNEFRLQTRDEQLASWNRMLAERSPLTQAERADGAIDTQWFHEVYTRLGSKRWDRIAAAARFASNAGQAKRAQTIADVLLGKLAVDEIIAGIEKKQLKDLVRLLGLAPLPAGARRGVELRRRFQALANYQRYARQLSGLTRPQAMRALEIGLKNLAHTAGYSDPMRLEWALGAEDLQDLARGPVSAEHQSVRVSLAIENGLPLVSAMKGGKLLASTPAPVRKAEKVAALYERSKDLKRQASRLRSSLESAMCRGDRFTPDELVQLFQHPLLRPVIERLVLVGEGILGYPDKGGRALRDHRGHLEPIKKQETLRVAHSFDLWKSGAWSDWQRDCFQAERIQPFKQVFRELYVPTRQELSKENRSTRFAGHQINPQQALALWTTRGWSTAEGVFRTFHDLDLTVNVGFRDGALTPLEVEGLTLEEIRFFRRGDRSADGLKIAEVPPYVFSEVMRDCDLVVSVAHRGGVDPEASESTVEMRASLIRETATLLNLKNVRLKASHAFVDGHFSAYSVHLGSGGVHRLPGGSLCIVPVHAQHRGRLFLPFADDDPKTAEIVSKVLLLARDHDIQDPGILEQLRR